MLARFHRALAEGWDKGGQFKKNGMNIQRENKSILLYEADGSFRLDVPIDGDTVWLSLNQMASLFARDKSTISRHIKNVFDEGELLMDSTVADFATVQLEGSREVSRSVEHYNLDVIISVGYRVKSQRGTQFRIWATQRLRDYLIKGFAMDDVRLKEAGNSRYFEELLQRIRDIRSSEKVFWRKVLDIYATSIDYDPQSELSHEFFANVQNQLHWSAHGHTAAEIIYQRADASESNMGITNYPGNTLLKRDTEIAKNYLKEDELNLLNRIVSAYLELAEIQALSQVTMTMSDWIERLQQFLAMTGRDILSHAGKISRDEALVKAREEYGKFKSNQISNPTQAEKNFVESLESQFKEIEGKDPTK